MNLSLSLFDILPVLAVFAMLYAALTGWRFGMRVQTERSGRRKGLVLNVARRAGPLVLAGLVVLVVGGAIGARNQGWLAALLIGGGLSYGLHIGLGEMKQDTGMLMGLRFAASLGLTLAFVWQSGLV